MIKLDFKKPFEVISLNVWWHYTARQICHYFCHLQKDDLAVVYLSDNISRHLPHTH